MNLLHLMFLFFFEVIVGTTFFVYIKWYVIFLILERFLML